MFNTNNTRVWEEEEYNASTMQNCITLLQSERGELLGDPFYGVLLKHYLYEQNGPKIADLLIDTIYEQLAIFLPQVRVNRNDIQLYANPTKGTVICKFKGINQIDYQINTYDLVVFKDQ